MALLYPSGVGIHAAGRIGSLLLSRLRVTNFARSFFVSGAIWGQKGPDRPRPASRRNPISDALSFSRGDAGYLGKIATLTTGGDKGNGVEPSCARRSQDLEEDQEGGNVDLAFSREADRLLQDIYSECLGEGERGSGDGGGRGNIADLIDSVDLKGDGVLELNLGGDEGTIVINRHYIHKQLWYSYTKSGADYFDFSPESREKWVSRRSGKGLIQQLEEDLSRALRRKVTFFIRRPKPTHPSTPSD